MIVFDANDVGGAPRPAEDEIAAVRWFDAHPDGLLYGDLADLSIPAAEE